MKTRKVKKPNEAKKDAAATEESIGIDAEDTAVESSLAESGRGKRKRVLTAKAAESSEFAKEFGRKNFVARVKREEPEPEPEPEPEATEVVDEKIVVDDGDIAGEKIVTVIKTVDGEVVAEEDGEDGMEVDVGAADAPVKKFAKLAGGGEEEAKGVDEKPVKVRKERASIPCPQCGKKHRNMDHLEKHILVVHENIKPYLCDICGFGTNLRVKMELHMATKHNDDKVLSYMCDVCDYKCSNQLHLRAHLQIVHLENLTPFECGVCQYQCRKRASVVKHMKIVHEKRRPFQCSQCDKAFPVNSVLLRHIESVHEKVRPFKCDICGYAFSEKRFLEKHTKAVHDKIKPVSCEHCDYKCVTRDTLARHMWHKHERAPRFCCRMCDAKYMKRTDLEIHYKNDHNQTYKAYACDKCGYATDKKNRLDKHLAVDHSEANRFAKQIMEEKGHFPVKKPRGRPPKGGFPNPKMMAPANYIRMATTRHFYSSDSDDDDGMGFLGGDSDEDLTLMDEDDYDWKPAGLTKIKQPKIKREKRSIRRPPPGDFIVPDTLHVDDESIVKVEETGDEDEHKISATEENITMVDTANEIIEGRQEVIYDTGNEVIVATGEGPDGVVVEESDPVQFLGGTANNKILSITKKEPVEGEDDMSGEPSIKFCVKTQSAPGDEPVEFEVELKDQKLIASGKLEDHTQTVMNLLSEGNVVDAILSNLAAEKAGMEAAAAETTKPPADRPQRVETALKRRLETKKFLCDDCGFTCASKTTLNTHKMFKHGDLPPKSLTCEQCEYTCDHPTQLTSHVRIIHEENAEPVECALCPLQVRTQSELDKHLRNIHSEEKPFVCSHCGHRFNKKSNMVKHVKMVHEKLRPWTCEECQKSFSDRRDLVAHEDAVHRGLKPHGCPYCDYKCARKKNLYVHIKNIHGGDRGIRTVKPSYECGQCGHVAKHRKLLEQHIRSVHEITVKEFQCGLCEFKAATKMSVDRHMQSHTKERRSLTAGECSMCGEAFTNAAKLVSHMRSVHGSIDKTYQCESCEYRGATHSALKAHMRAVHENIRKHRCDYCEFTSFASSALKRHILAIHEKRKPFACDKCSFKSSYKESLELHLANRHKDLGVPDHLAIKAMNKKRRKSDRLPPPPPPPPSQPHFEAVDVQPDFVTTEFVVTDEATEEAIAAQTITADEINAADITTETIEAETMVIL